MRTSTPTDTMEEKRLFTRVSSSLEVDLVFNDGHQLSGRLRNLSMRGLFLASDATPRIGSVCDVRVYLAGREHHILVEVKGQVARCAEGGVGVRFVTLSYDAFDQLREIVASAAFDRSVIDEEIARHLGVAI